MLLIAVLSFALVVAPSRSGWGTQHRAGSAVDRRELRTSTTEKEGKVVPVYHILKNTIDQYSTIMLPRSSPSTVVIVVRRSAARRVDSGSLVVSPVFLCLRAIYSGVVCCVTASHISALPKTCRVTHDHSKTKPNE